jgi:hypothetical protein
MRARAGRAARAAARRAGPRDRPSACMQSVLLLIGCCGSDSQSASGGGGARPMPAGRCQQCSSASRSASMMGLALLFYCTASVSTLVVWAVLSCLRGTDYHDSRRYALATRPSLVPAAPLLLLLRTRWLYLALCHGAPLAMGMAALTTSTAHEGACRLFAAVVYSLYVLAETATTHSHRDYATMYIGYAHALLPPKWAAAVSLGVAAHFVASSGLSKCLVAGFGGWCDQATLHAVLKHYLADNSSDGPGSPWLTRWLLGRPWALRLCAAGTMALECVAVPGSLLLPPEWRAMVVVPALIAMHLGIAASQSLLIGLAFLVCMADDHRGSSSPSCTSCHYGCIAIVLVLAHSSWC